MKIVFVALSSIGGSSTLAAYLANMVHRAGHEVIWAAERPHRYLDDGIHTRIIPPHDEANPVGVAGRAYGALKLAVQEFNADLLHIHFAIPFAISAQMLAKDIGIPYLVTLHGSDVHNDELVELYEPMLHLSLEDAKGITTISKDLKDRALARWPLMTEPVVINNFVPLDTFHPLKGNRNQFSYKILHISNFRENKNIQLIIHAFAKAKALFPPLRLLLVGNGPEMPNLTELVKDLDIQDSVEFMGIVRDANKLNELYNEIDLFAMASYHEGMPMVILESLQCGTPILSSRVGGIPEIVGEDWPFLFESGNVDACFLAMKSFYETEQNLTILRQKSLHLSKQFLESSILMKYLCEYSKLIKNTEHE